MFHHRSSLLKQKNKAFKKTQGHISKRKRKDQNKGKVESLPEIAKSNHRTSNKLERENKQRQLRKAKTMATVEKRRKAASSDAPVVILLVPFTASADAHWLHQWILQSPGVKAQSCVLQWNHYILLKGTSDEACTRWNLVSIQDLSNVMDWLKIADVVVPIFYGDESVEEFAGANYCLEVLRTMGISRLIPVAMFPEKRKDQQDSPILKQHEMNEIRKQRAQFLVDQSVAEEVEQARPITVSQEGHIQQLIRVIATKTPRRPKWRDARSYVVADSYQWVDRNVLQVVGYIRGRPWLCKRLIYLAGIGSFQPIRITTQKEPCPRKSSCKSMDTEDKVLLETVPGDPSFDTIISFYEQEESNDKELEDQMDMYSDDTVEDAMCCEGVDHFEEPIDTYEAQSVAEEPSSDRDEMELESGDNNADIDEDELTKLRNEMKDELLFPDERDTPLDQPARERFHKYRGLDSLANSEWDTEQDLPLDYKRIFKFANFDAFKKKQLALENSELKDSNHFNAIPSGTYVTFYLHVDENDRNFVASRLEYSHQHCLVGVCLHRNEHRYSVIHFHVRRTLLDYQLQDKTAVDDNLELLMDKLPSNASSMVKSKDLLEIQCGFFKYLAKPVFSIPVNHSKKLKYIKFLPNHQNVVASVYGPCVYPPAPVLITNPSQGHLIAQGSMLSIDTDRIILKRIVLSGFPYRVFKSRAVVRYMFFNREDILWFQPYPLWTKRGRLGSILEPVGTHGYMKCRFNGHLKAQDTVCLSIYKRVFPKWVTKEEYLQLSLC